MCKLPKRKRVRHETTLCSMHVGLYLYCRYNKVCAFLFLSRCNDDVSCTWTHSPLGLKYELLAGPFFTFVYTLATIPLGILASNRWVNRRVTLSIFVILWSSMTLASAFTHRYWQFLLARLGLGLL